jgi:hypothetical protein
MIQQYVLLVVVRECVKRGRGRVLWQEGMLSRRVRGSGGRCCPASRPAASRPPSCCVQPAHMHVLPAASAIGHYGSSVCLSCSDGPVSARSSSLLMAAGRWIPCC